MANNLRLTRRATLKLLGMMAMAGEGLIVWASRSVPPAAVTSGATGCFPEHSLDALQRGWYSTFLRAMQEPSLWEASTDPHLHSYRCLWLRTFHAPIAVRVTIDRGGTGELTAKVLDGQGGYAPGKLVKNQTAILSKEQIDSILNHIQTSNVWHLPSWPATLVPPPPDGARWILEGVKNGQYHVVARFSPEPGPFRDTAFLFLDLSGLPLTPMY